MNILADLHHNSLFYSFQLLFEKRLGHKLLRPFGIEWWKEGYWNLNNLEPTARQYLETGYTPIDKTNPLNNVDHYEKDIVYLKDYQNDSEQKGITFNTFQQMPIDIVIASIPAHIKPFQKLASLKGAKFIFQMGNVFPEVINNLHELPNIMANTLPPHIPSTCHYIQYHQEFDLTIFRPETVKPKKQIVSFINVYQENKGFEDYVTLKSMMPEFTFKSYGGQGIDGSIGKTEDIARIMQESYFGMHSKHMGDGYGHVLWNWAFVGKPIITRISDYKGKCGEILLEHMETCIDLDVLSYEEACGIIQNIHPEKYQYMCQEIRRRAVKEADFDKEEIKIRKFLDNLI